MNWRGYAWRIINRVQRSDLLPAPLRMVLLRAAGMDLHPTAWISSGCNFGSRRVSLGERSRMNFGCYYDGGAHLVIGADTGIGPFVRFITGTHAMETFGPVRRPYHGGHSSYRVIVVCDGSEVLAGATLLSGVIVNPGTVIAAGSMVRENARLERMSLYAGVPAVWKRSYSDAK